MYTRYTFRDTLLWFGTKAIYSCPPWLLYRHWGIHTISSVPEEQLRGDIDNMITWINQEVLLYQQQNRAQQMRVHI